MTPQTPSQKYRATMKKNGFLYRCFWIHKGDLAEIKQVIDIKAAYRATRMLEEQAKKGKK